jgi:hypothetical protein
MDYMDSMIGRTWKNFSAAKLKFTTSRHLAGQASKILSTGYPAVKPISSLAKESPLNPNSTARRKRKTNKTKIGGAGNRTQSETG